MSPVIRDAISSPAAGAWKIPTTYCRTMVTPTDPWQAHRVRYAVMAIQKVLIERKYLVANPLTLNGGWGLLTDAATKQFQADAGLTADGKFGPKSALRLWLPYYQWWQAVLAIPDQLLWGMGVLESALDPGAEGPNPKGWEYYDRGIMQFNRRWHPEISDAQAFGDVPWCIATAGQSLHDAYVKLGSWQCAVANHNSPAAALAWSRTGTAPNDVIARYVELVYNAAKTLP